MPTCPWKRINQRLNYYCTATQLGEWMSFISIANSRGARGSPLGQEWHKGSCISEKPILAWWQFTATVILNFTHLQAAWSVQVFPFQSSAGGSFIPSSPLLILLKVREGLSRREGSPEVPAPPDRIVTSLRKALYNKQGSAGRVVEKPIGNTMLMV